MRVLRLITALKSRLTLSRRSRSPCVLELLVEVGGVEEGLGRDAPAEGGSAAQAGGIALDGGHAGPIWAARMAATYPRDRPDHRDVEFPVGHICSPVETRV